MKPQTEKISQKRTLFKILKYIGKYWAPLLISTLLTVFSVASTLYIPTLTGDAIDLILGKGNVHFSEILTVVRKILVTAALTASAQWVMTLCNNAVTYRVIHDLREDAMRKIQVLPISYIDSHPYGDIISRVISDVDQFADGLLLGFSHLFSGIITILGTLGFMMSMNFGMAALVVCITPVSMFVTRFIAGRTYAMFSVQSKIRGNQTAFINEMITGQKTVQAYGQEDTVLAAFDVMNDQLKESSLRAIFYSSISFPSTRFVNGLVYTAVTLAGSYSVIAGGLSIGQLSCFLSYANQYTKPFNEISSFFTEFQNAIVCAARIFEFLEEEPQTPDSDHALVLRNPQGAVDLRDVSFSYQPNQNLIADLNLNVQPGQRIAIVGPTGCGKTTLINLLMRFYDIDSGKISVDGHDIRAITRESLRANYGMALQDTWLRSGTIRDNLTFGKPDATDAEVIQAAKAAFAHPFIKRLPNGYDSLITEDGGNLSQGERQLLCIARVMLCLPPMLILDEATSSIDTRTEMKIQKAFGLMMEGRTSFIVAHRLSTIQEADVILVMRDGRIIEQGKHERLLAANGFYAHLFNSQFL